MADLREPGPPPAFSVAEIRDPALLIAAMGGEAGLVAGRLARGVRAFGAYRDCALAGYGWLTAGPEWIGELGAEIHPGPGEAYVWNCVTLPQHRLQGVFRSFLLGVREQARGEGLERLWIGSHGGALSAVRAAGFRPVLALEPPPRPIRRIH